MAEENKIPLEIEVKGSEESIESFKDLKAAIKAAKDEQIKAASVYGESSKEYQKATQKVSALKDKVDDLNDSTKSLKGSGVERASEGFNQLGEGLRNLDFDKVKVGLVAMKSALAAVGIGLIVQAVTYLVENFDELSKGSGLLAKALRFVGDVIGGIKDALLDFGDVIQGINPELRKMSSELDGVKESMNGLLSEQTGRLDRLIAVTKANGESTIAYENLKQEAIIKTNKLYVDGIINYVKAGGQLNDEQKKQLTASLENIKNAKTQQTVLEIGENKKQLEDYKKHLEEKKKLDKEAADAKFLREQQVKADIDANIKREEDRLKKELEDERLAYENKKLLDIEVQDAKDARYKAARDKKRAQDAQDLADAKALEAQKVQLATDGIRSVQGLTDLFFMFKSQKAKKGSKEEEDLARKQFNINKGLQLGLAVIDGFKSINASLAQSPIAVGVVPNPVGIASLAFASITAATNIAKIAATKFQSSGGSGGGEAPSTSTPSIPAPPTISTQQNNLNQSTQFDSNGKRIGSENNQPMKITATIGVDEITKKTDRVDTLEKQSTF
jgi:hypothetical protein